MNKLHDHLMTKINKSAPTSISMRLRLFMFLLLLVLTMVAGIVVILLVTGIFSAGISESERFVQNELQESAADISAQYGQLSVLTVEFSEVLSSQLEEELQKRGLPFPELSKHPEIIEELIAGLFEETYYSLQKSNCSGAFFILDTTVNPNLVDWETSKAGLYIKNMEPNILSSSFPTFTLLRGFSDIGRSNSINLHTQWSMEFDVSEADYYTKPIQAALDDSNLSLSKLYYWCDPQLLPGTSEEVMLCSVPLINSRKQIYGVCGFEISAMLFKLSHIPANTTYTRMFCMLSPLSNQTISIHRSMFAGGYSVKEFTDETMPLQIKNSKRSFTTYDNGDKQVFLGYHSKTQLYQSGSPFSEEDWITAVLIPREDIVSSITNINIILICLLSLLVTLGIIISVIFSNKYLKPLSQGIELIKSAKTEEMPRTNVQEIDDLIQYLAIYKNEMMQKAEKERYQLSLLERFIERARTLTPAERLVFNHYSKGLSAQEIADEMFLSINTIKSHSKRIFVKLNITSREELLLYINMLKEIGVEL